MGLSLTEALLIAFTSIAMVFLVLVGLMLVTMTFKYIFKEPPSEKAPAPRSGLEKAPAPDTLPLNKDPEMVAALTALIVANEETPDNQYTVVSVERMNAKGAISDST